MNIFGTGNRVFNTTNRLKPCIEFFLYLLVLFISLCPSNDLSWYLLSAYEIYFIANDTQALTDTLQFWTNNFEIVFQSSQRSRIDFYIWLFDWSQF